MRTINLELYDLADIVKRYDKEKRFSILIQIGEFSYFFSNKEKAKRFLKRYERYLIDTLSFSLSNLNIIVDIHINLLRYNNFLNSKNIQSRIDSILELSNKLYSTSASFGNSIKIHWILLIQEYLLECCNLLKNVAKHSRYNVSELVRIKNLKTSLLLFKEDFQKKYKNKEFKGSINVNETKIIQLHDNLQIAINF